MPEAIRNLILGGGIAGLAAAHRLAEARQAATVFEAADHAGGLLAGFEVKGFRFDNGVHLSFATEPEVRAVFDRTPYLDHPAESVCWEGARWLKHPVQNNLYPLPAAEKAELIAGLAEAPDDAPATYEDWLIGQYGRPIAERFPLRYTEKYWTVPASALGTAWIGKRMRRADLKEVLFGAMSAETPSTYYISEMRYPREGGYGAFIQPLVDGAAVRLGARATALDPARRLITFADGTTVAYERLVSSIPLPVLAAITPTLPADLRADAETLFATRLDVISIGLSRADITPSLWFYIYDEDVWASRVYSPSVKSPANAPAGCGSLQFEIYSSVRRPQQHGPAEMIENCLAALDRLGLASRDDVLFAHHRHVPYANVVFDLGMEERRDRVKAWYAGHGVALAGRFGEWAYLWSNQSFMSGYRAAEQLLAAG